MGCVTGVPVLLDVAQPQPEQQKTQINNNAKQVVRPRLQARNSVYFTEDFFFDPDFFPELQICQDGYFEQIEWKRPHMLVPQPEMFVSGSTPGDIMQGLLGDCWFLSACASVSLHDKLMNRIIPEGQCLRGPGYTGMVRFRFWQYGRWVDVQIDDLIPTVKGKLVFAHSIDEHEFWVPLIEKAYAKLHGSYDALDGGRAMDAFVDLTGGFSERHELNELDVSIYNKMGIVKQSGGVIACSKKGKYEINNRTVDEYGLVSGHAYTVSDLQTIKHRFGTEHLVKVRNPWGDGAEWKGAWSDGDACWKWLDESDRKALQLQEEDDGEFWMSFDDFVHHFNEVTTCTSGYERDVCIAEGQWVSGLNAGGSRNCMETFATNPQFLLRITSEQETCSVHIALLQRPKDRRNMHQIGYILYECVGDVPLTYNDLCRINELGKSGVYINHREVNGKFELSNGDHVLIPSTFNSDDEGAFIVRASVVQGSVSIKAL